MAESAPPRLRLRDWDRLYENNRSREMKRTDWFPAPNDLSADGYVELVTHEAGAAHLGVLTAILMVASKARPRRGLLVREDGRPHTAESLARVTRLPQTVVQDALGRPLEIGLLEIVDCDPHEINDLPPHTGVGISQDTAVNPQDGAAEGKGTEHHHQEGKRTERKRTRTEPNGTEPQGTERARDEFATERAGAASGSSAFSQRKADDDENAAAQFASPDEELKAIYLAKAGEPITIEMLDAIRVNLELTLVSMGDFVWKLESTLETNGAILLAFFGAFRSVSGPGLVQQVRRSLWRKLRRRTIGVSFVARAFAGMGQFWVSTVNLHPASVRVQSILSASDRGASSARRHLLEPGA